MDNSLDLIGPKLDQLDCFVKSVQEFKMEHAVYGIDKHRLQVLKHLASECEQTLEDIRRILNDV